MARILTDDGKLSGDAHTVAFAASGSSTQTETDGKVTVSGLGGGGAGTLAATLALGNNANALKITNLANGTAASDAAAFGQIPSLLSPTAVKTANYNAVVNDLVACDISSGSFTVTLPTAPADKSQVCIEVVNRVTTGAPYYVTVATGGSDVFSRTSGPTSKILGRGSIVLQYYASGAIWFLPGLGDFLPIGWEFGYDQITANVTITSTTESSGTAVLTAAAHVFDGEPVIAEFAATIYNSAAGSYSAIVNMFEGATQIGRLITVYTTNPAGIALGTVGSFRFTPTAGSHTYSLTAFTTGTDTGSQVQAGAAGTSTIVPARLRFTKA